MTSKIYYSKKEDYTDNLKAILKKKFGNCKKIAVKLHFGEPGNKTAFFPEQIKPVLNILKELQIDFFLFDTPVAYNSPRGTVKDYLDAAKNRGWDKLGEIVIDNGYITVNGNHMNYQVASKLSEVDGVFVISHFKGHVCSGFGGAIKNLGMGALTKKTKSDIHSGGSVYFEGNCDQCGACERACPIKGIRVKEKPIFNTCFGCSNCVEACPNNSLHVNIAKFDKLLADGANAAQSKFKNYFYLNIAKNITKLCDCESDSGKIISNDIGYLYGEDAVALDNACHDIICKVNGKDVFLENNKKSGLAQVTAAESFGMGAKEYELIRL